MLLQQLLPCLCTSQQKCQQSHCGTTYLRAVKAAPGCQSHSPATDNRSMQWLHSSCAQPILQQIVHLSTKQPGLCTAHTNRTQLHRVRHAAGSLPPCGVAACINGAARASMIPATAAAVKQRKLLHNPCATPCHRHPDRCASKQNQGDIVPAVAAAAPGSHAAEQLYKNRLAHQWRLQAHTSACQQPRAGVAQSAPRTAAAAATQSLTVAVPTKAC
jgi:hypothetical protein